MKQSKGCLSFLDLNPRSSSMQILPTVIVAMSFAGKNVGIKFFLVCLCYTNFCNRRSMNLELISKQLTNFCRDVLFAGAYSEAEHLKNNKF